MSYLESIHSTDDLKKLSFSELNLLAAEIREFLISHVSKTGGHLASNLGIVEITIAIENIFNPEKDRILFDVGHQSYVHKILTGRSAQFDCLRKYTGISGFPKPSESNTDAFTAGHASTALSTALGMARARTLQNEDYSVIVVVGDGAASGGVFFEALNDAGTSKEPLIVIMNDNGMSISKNVGGFSKHLSQLRLMPGYFGLKKAYRKFMTAIPGGTAIYKATHKLKNFLHRTLLGSTLFEEMGFIYYGPVDGHNIEKLSYLLSRAKEETGPVLIHAITKKGMGYTPAEKDPDSYHGVGKFDPKIGIESSNQKLTYSLCFSDLLIQEAKTNDKICAITAGMTTGTGLTEFAKEYPSRFFDVGITEEHAVSMAAGMAKQGLVPVVAIYSTFLLRSLDMIMQDVAIQKLHVVFCVDRAGLVGEDGETHQGLYDVGMLNLVPGMEILCPAGFRDFREAFHYAVSAANGPVAIRYPRGTEGTLKSCNEAARSSEQSVITFVSYGNILNDVVATADALSEEGIVSDIVPLLKIKPFDPKLIVESVKRTGKLVIVEEQDGNGGIYRSIIQAVHSSCPGTRIKVLNTGDGFVQQGTIEQLKSMLAIDKEHIIECARRMLAL